MRLKSALFVNFDNLFNQIANKAGSALASKVAQDPDILLSHLDRSWIQKHLFCSTSHDKNQLETEFSPYGFIVEQQQTEGANPTSSLDIALTISVLDFITEHSNAEELILVSPLSDLSPLIERINEFDIRVSVLSTEANKQFDANDKVSEFYAVEDLIRGIEPAVNSIDQAENLASQDPSTRDKPVSDKHQSIKMIVDQVAQQIARAIEIQGPMDAGRIPRFFTNFREFRESERRGKRWFGFRSLKELSKQLELSGLGLKISESEHNPQDWSLVLNQSSKGDSELGFEFRRKILDTVNDILQTAKKPLPLSRLGLEVGKLLGSEPKDTDWGGAGSLSILIKQANKPSLAVSDLGQGYVFDPDSHDLKEIEKQELPQRNNYPKELEEFIEETSALTNMPPLGPKEYEGMFKAIHQSVSDNGFPGILNLSKQVRDVCRTQRIRVARSHVNFILNQLTSNRYFLDEKSTDPETLAEAVADRTIELLDRANRQLDEHEEDLLDQMFGLMDLEA